MKKLMAISIITMFMFGCAANNTLQGGALGAGAGTIASVISGKSGAAAAIIIMGGALLGGIIGNSMDEQAKAASLEPQNRGKQVMIVEETPTNAKTKCRKVTKKVWKDGNKVSEVTEEVCTGKRTSNSYE